MFKIKEMHLHLFLIVTPFTAKQTNAFVWTAREIKIMRLMTNCIILIILILIILCLQLVDLPSKMPDIYTKKKQALKLVDKLLQYDISLMLHPVVFLL